MNKWFRFCALCALLAVVFWPASSVNAQNETVQYGKENIARDYCAGYNITVKSTPDCDSKLYLYSISFGKSQLVDSAVFENETASFTAKINAKSNKDAASLIPKGFYKIVARDIYTLVRDNTIDSELSFDLDEEKKSDKPAKVDTFYQEYPISILLNQQTSIELWFDRTRVEPFEVLKSDENLVLLSMMSRLKDQFEFSTYERIDEELCSTMPKSFFSQEFHIDYEVLQAMESASFIYSAISAPVYHKVLSMVDFTDGRLCHSTSTVYYFIQKYLTSENRESVDEIIAEVDTILVRAARGGRYQCGLYAQWLYNIFDKTGDPYYEPVLLHIYDTYDRGWIPEDQERRIKRQMDRIRKLAPGAQIPELTAYDINGKQHSTNDIKTKYTVLWFWDPDCDHCQEETPILHDIYQKQADELGFEVFAVEVNDDYDRWKAFSEKYGLNDWINLSTSMGESSVDFIEYFDIVTTPVILLIDNEKNHAIIARQVTLEELVRKIKN